MATPLAAGLVGLMLSVNPSLSSSDILNCLTTTGVNINQNIGPRIDAYAAMLCALPESNNAIPAFTASPRTTYENGMIEGVHLYLDEDGEVIEEKIIKICIDRPQKGRINPLQ